MRVRHAELFAGIGGFSLAAHWIGWENVFQVEIDEWCKRRLKKNFNGAKIYGDIKEFNGKKYKGQIDVISGGFPCQPFSVSGNRQGADDDRYLWPEMLRVLKEVRPQFIVAENVPGIISMGLDQVLDDLEGEGYTCWPPLVIPAGAVGADHLRERVWVVANTNKNGCKKFLPGKKITRPSKSKKKNKCYSLLTSAEQYESSFFEPILLSNKDGLPPSVDSVNTLKAMGNAIVPQIAYTIFNHINNFLN